jgi:hypothetical protein
MSKFEWKEPKYLGFVRVFQSPEIADSARVRKSKGGTLG